MRAAGSASTPPFLGVFSAHALQNFMNGLFFCTHEHKEKLLIKTLQL
jgi:hypothetical protein